jgi:HAD superfamily hydrolase (TIGR01509 family)
MIRAVIFDFNGILADDDPIHMQAFRRVAEEEGLRFSDAEYLDRYLPLNDRDCFLELWQSNNRSLDEARLRALIERKGVYYFEAIAEKSVLFDGAAAAIRAASSRGPVGIASGARGGEIRHILGEAGLLDCFTAVVAAEDVTHGKPDPEPFRLAYQRMQFEHPELHADQCLAVEDSLGGIHSARAAGLPCLGVAHSYPVEKLEGSEANWVIRSIADFAEWLPTV